MKSKTAKNRINIDILSIIWMHVLKTFYPSNALCHRGKCANFFLWQYMHKMENGMSKTIDFKTALNQNQH